MEEVLKQTPGANVQAFVIWEPILPSDWARPGARVLARVSDGRAQQFWDPEHLFARQLAQRLRTDPAHPQPKCCDENDIPWDMVAVYPPGSRWESELPRASYLDGPVWRVAAEFKMAAERLK